MGVLVLVAGCAAPASPQAAPASPQAVPTSSPTVAPHGPTDLIKKTGVVVGTVTRGGSGPCYGLETDDGTEYAVHVPGGRVVTKGERVRVSVTPSTRPPDCGPGRPIEATAIEPLG